MSDFPLYNNLIKGIQDKPLSAYQKKKLLKEFELLGDEQHELIYVLIKTYESINCSNTDTVKAFPFNISFSEQTIKIDLAQLPNKLQQLICKFTNTHIKSLKN